MILLVKKLPLAFLMLLLVLVQKNVFCIGSETVLTISFSNSRNLFDSPFELSITCNNQNASIYYTTNCSTPSVTNGELYNNPLLIDTTTIVKAVAVFQGNNSDVITHTFIFPEHSAKQPKNPLGFPAAWGGTSIIDADYEMDAEVINHPDYASKIDGAFRSLPCLSLSMETDGWFNFQTGLYVGYPDSKETREKPVTAEFIFNDERENFAVECGVQNQGGTSIVKWKVPKQSMRLLFKEMYGPKRLTYKLFHDSEIESINTLVVDGLLNGTWLHPWDDKQRTSALYFRDQLTSDLQNEMGWLSFHGEYYHLFLNGLYWGIYDLHERPDDAFLSEYLDADREDFDIVKHNPNDVVSGSNASYYALLEKARQGFFSYQDLIDIQEFLDLPAFIDYMILNFFLGNFDWAHQNYYAGRNSVKQTGYRYYTWDAEHVMRFSNVNYNNTGKNDEGGPTEIHTLLKANEEYRMMFADAVYKHLFNTGALATENFEKSFLFRKNEIEEAIILESARWGDYRKEITDTTYTKNEFWVPEVKKVLEEYIPQRRDIFLGQLREFENRLFPLVMPPSVVVSESGQTKNIHLIDENKTPGQLFYTIDGSDPRRIGGAVNGKKYSEPFVLQNSAIIKARFLSNENEWSALAEEIVLFDDIVGNEVVINEIMYNPDNDFPEFIELVNSGNEVQNLKGFAFTDGIEFEFNEWQELLPGAGIVLTSDTTLFRNSYGFEAAGQYQKKLSNNGERIELVNALQQVVDSLTYSDTIPWPDNDKESGFSIQLVNPKLDNSLPENWKISEEKNGSPYNPGSKLEFDVSIYPNPFSDDLTISFKNKDLAFERFSLELFEPAGKKIKQVQVNAENGRIKLNARGLSGGLYVVRLTPATSKNYKAMVLNVVKTNH